jgi:hypothetical protein
MYLLYARPHHGMDALAGSFYVAALVVTAAGLALAVAAAIFQERCSLKGLIERIGLIAVGIVLRTPRKAGVCLCILATLSMSARPVSGHVPSAPHVTHDLEEVQLPGLSQQA